MTKYLQIQLEIIVLSSHYYIITLKYNCFNTLKCYSYKHIKVQGFNTLKCYPYKPTKVQGFTALKRYPYKPIGVQGFNALKYEIPTKPIGIVGEAGVHPYKGFFKNLFSFFGKIPCTFKHQY